MKLRVKDIVKIWNNGAASLVAGQEGLMRRIEVFDMMEQPNIKPWLREHLLLITTGYVIRNDKEALLNLIRDMNEVNASALAIKTRFFEDFPKEALQLADELKPIFDYIILDCPAGIEQGFKNAIAAADRAIVMTTPEVSAIRDADRIIGLLEAEGKKKIDLVINRIRMDMVKRGDMMSVEDVLDILSVNLLGVIPDEEDIVVATNHGEPVVGTETAAGTAYMNICRRLEGEKVPLQNLDKTVTLKNRITGFFRRKS